MTHEHGLRATLAVLAGMLIGPAASGAGPVPPTTIGVNISPPAYYRARVFANLVMGTEWGASNRMPLGPETVDPNGGLRQMPPGATMGRMLTPPNAGTRAVTIRCTWQGKAIFRPASPWVQNVRSASDSLSLDARPKDTTGRIPPIPLNLTTTDAANPLRDLDCRETSLSPSARFDPRFLDSLRGFKVIRFMDWQRSNANEPVTWATRHTPRSIDVTKGDGVSIEDMIALSKELGADPWFNMPWNADDNYVEHFARLVHDSLPDRTVYVELGNEVWNRSFLVSKQAMEEGRAQNLSNNLAEAGLMRYAQRLSHVLDIWARVYADRPKGLVRVASCQNSSYCARTVLGFADTARHVDALATAPYFGTMLNRTPPANTDEAFGRMNAEIDRVLDLAASAKQVAAQHGKRYIAYEAGQHLLLRDMPLMEQIQRDPRMADAYKYYLESWRAKLGDTIMLYYSAGPIGRFGAWGLSEYIGQPIAEAPKLRAVRDEIALISDGKRPR